MYIEKYLWLYCFTEAGRCHVCSSLRLLNTVSFLLWLCSTVSLHFQMFLSIRFLQLAYWLQPVIQCGGPGSAVQTLCSWFQQLCRFTVSNKHLTLLWLEDHVYNMESTVHVNTFPRQRQLADNDRCRGRAGLSFFLSAFLTLALTHFLSPSLTDFK